MADGYESYDVQNHNRRDSKIPDLHGCAGFVPIYDPSSYVSSDLISCSSDRCKSSSVCVGKDQDGTNFMSFIGGILNVSSCSSSTSHCSYLDPQSSFPINSASIPDVNNNPFFFAPHNLRNLRDFEQQFVLKAESMPVSHDQSNTTSGQGLSLSLSSQHNTYRSNLPLELNSHRSSPVNYRKNTGETYRGGCAGDYALHRGEASRGLAPLGALAGYASILKESRFLKPAQQLLEELCSVGRSIGQEKVSMVCSLMDPPLECFCSSGMVDESLNSADSGESCRKKSSLISLLDEVYRRYKQHFHQMQSVITCFECVAGPSGAAPYAYLCLKTMSKHFKALKNAITEQLQFINNGHGKEATRLGNADRSLYSSRGVYNSELIEHQPVWRPQRGLPERAVTILRAWLFEHFLHPYPTDTDKLTLAKQTGLSRNQVSNWFINARVRLWKPMVEEIHMLETRQAQKGSATRAEKERRASWENENGPASKSITSGSENPSPSVNRVQEMQSNSRPRERAAVPDLPVAVEQPMSMSYNQQQEAGLGASVGRGSGGHVSLTLGLHQNRLSEPFPPIHAAQRFGLALEAAGGDQYVVDSFHAQSRLFGRDVIGEQFLHDFVG